MKGVDSKEVTSVGNALGTLVGPVWVGVGVLKAQCRC
jgi:hypothetical protein